jgi:cyclase
MLKHRLIPVLLLQNGLLVRSERFSVHQVIGNPLNEVRRFNEWSVDELIYLDITKSGHYHAQRSDHQVVSPRGALELLELVSRDCFMPLTWGGRIRTREDMAACIRHGADKVAINTAALERPALITEGARTFGSQAVVVSIDVGVGSCGPRTVLAGGNVDTGRSAVQWAREAEACGAGELLLQSVVRDGTGEGYDLDLIAEVASATTIPVIACSGVGSYSDYAEGIRSGASAVAAANIWHFKELADRGGKRALLKAGVDVRVEGLRP